MPIESKQLSRRFEIEAYFTNLSYAGLSLQFILTIMGKII